jgi:hypothetical protein
VKTLAVRDAVLFDFPSHPPDEFSAVMFGWVYCFARRDRQPASTYCWYEVTHAETVEDSQAR